MKKALKEEILTMTILKRANKQQYGNLQISLKNNNLLGKNDYPVTISDLLKVMINYAPKWTLLPSNNSTSGTSVNIILNRENNTNTISILFLQANGTLQVRYLRGTNNLFSAGLYTQYIT